MVPDTTPACTCIHERTDVPLLGTVKVLVLADPLCEAHGRRPEDDDDGHL